MPLVNYPSSLLVLNAELGIQPLLLPANIETFPEHQRPIQDGESRASSLFRTCPCGISVCGILLQALSTEEKSRDAEHETDESKPITGLPLLLLVTFLLEPP